MLCSYLYGLMWEWAVEFNALLVFVGSHVGVGRRVQCAARVCMWEWAIEFKALLRFVGSHVGVGHRVQCSVPVCRVSCGSGPLSSRLCSCL